MSLKSYEIIIPVIKYDVVETVANNLDEANDKVQRGVHVLKASKTFVDYENMKLYAIDGEKVE